MNSTEHIHSRAKSFNRFFIRPIFALCMALAVSRAGAVDDYFINQANVTYPGTAPFPPQIDALNFINSGSFTVNFTSPSLQPYYETSDTLNYTNTGFLNANTGFLFDNFSAATGFHFPAASFFNQGTVSCGSVNNLGDPFGGLLGLLGFAQCRVSATNIVNPGIVVAGQQGLIQFTGQNVNLSRSTLSIEGIPFNTGGVGVAGLNTNRFLQWDPSLFLGATFAESAYFPLPPNILGIFNSTAYINTTQGQGTTNIVRCVFIEDDSIPSTAVSVFFDSGGVIGPGNVTIQWAGSYLDSASGNTYSNYLYLNNDYKTGASTNVTFINGVPSSMRFSQSTTPQNFGVPPAPAGFTPVFPSGVVTNLYVFGNIQLIASSVSTNSVANGSVTNLPGRVEISGANNLDLSYAQISGQSYMSIVSTNQFNGSAGAFIATPYADLNLGTTNGSLIVSNIMEPSIPLWGGTVQAWNTRWISTDPVLGTNDFRVLIVRSQLTTTILGQVQDLILHDYSSNSIILSDTMNVMRTFYADSQSLTLTTNPIGNGATSLEGELNLQNPNIFFQSSVPNLRYLTNNGAIRAQNLAIFGNPFVTNVTSAVAARGTLSEIGTNVVKNDKVTIGTNSYTFVSALSGTANQVAIVPASFDGSISNLIAAINGAAGAGVAYSSATKSNSQVTAGALMNHAFTVTALAPGIAGNAIITKFIPATASSNLTWGGSSTLVGGAAESTNIVPFLFSTALINNGVFMDQGSIIDAGNFESSGVFSNGVGSFNLQSLTTTLTNGALSADGDVSITASNLVTSNLLMQAGRSLTLTVTNLLTDSGPSPTNLSLWSVGALSVGSGFNLPIKPASGDLLGTTILLSAPTNRNVVSTWAGVDHGLSNSGYTNNEAIGRLIMNAANNTPTRTDFGVLSFNAAGVSNAIYIDELILTNFSVHGNATNLYNFPWLKIGTNMFVYFAQAIANGNSVAEAIDNASKNGANGGRLRWISSYTGYYSSTNLVSTNTNGTITTNTVNAALAASSTIDSDSDGRPNSVDSTPFLLASEINLTSTVTNVPPQMVKVQWTTIPNATNFIYYSTNFASTNWLPYTNFQNWYYGNNVAVTNAAHGNGFRSPQVYVNNASLPDNSQQTNVWVFDAITNVPHYYKVVVWPWVTFPE
jgi:hypothetical protein